MTSAPDQAEPTTLAVALCQMRGGLDPAANAADAEALIREAAAGGAELIATPEATNIIQRDGAALQAAVVPSAGDIVRQRLAALAGELGVWILAGSLMVRGEKGGVANRAHLFDPAGALTAVYDKIHLFDVTLSEQETYAESDTVVPGAAAVLAPTPFAPLGLTICYDLRFPQLYRALAKAGAALIAAPAAFTRATGRAHWETLVRARAIEAGAFMLAPAQGGAHEDGRATWGRSMIVDPWGAVIAQLDHDEPGVLAARLDLEAVAKARRRLPSLTHDRPFADPKPAPARQADARPPEPAAP